MNARGRAIEVRVRRPLWFDFVRREPGDVLLVNPIQADDLLRSGRAELVSASDQAKVLSAMTRVRDAQMRALNDVQAWQRAAVN